MPARFRPSCSAPRTTRWPSALCRCDRQLLHAARLRRRACRICAGATLGGHWPVLPHANRTRAGRLRHRRVDRRPAVVQRQGRHGRRLARGHGPDRPGAVPSAASDGDLAGRCADNIYAHMSREGGAMALHMFGALFLHAQDSQEIRNEPGARQRSSRPWSTCASWSIATPFKPGPDAARVVPHLEENSVQLLLPRRVRRVLELSDCSDQGRYFDRHADIPGVYSGGWYDPFAIARRSYFAAMSEQNTHAPATDHGPLDPRAMRGDVDMGRRRRLRRRRAVGQRASTTGAASAGSIAGSKASTTASSTSRRCASSSWAAATAATNADGRLNHGGRWRDERVAARARRQHHVSTCTQVAPSAPTQPTRTAASHATRSTQPTRSRRSAAR